MIRRAAYTLVLLFCAHDAFGASPPPADGGRSFHVRDYGAVPDGKTPSGAAIRAAIRAAMAAAETADASVEVVLEAGTYLVRHENPRGYCFPIYQAANLTVRGTCRTRRCPTGVHTYTAVDVEGGSFDLKVEEGYPTPDAQNFADAHQTHGKWGMIIDPGTRRIRPGTPDHIMTPRWELCEGRVWRFFTANEHHRRNLAHMQVGDAYVHLARGHGSAVLAQGCDGIRIDNLTVHASPGLAVGLVGNRGEIVVRGLQVRFAPDTARLLTTNADGVHCQQNRDGPMIEDCLFEGMADDAINIYAPPNVLREIRAPNQWLVSSGCIILPGDRLQVLDPQTGRVRGEVRAVAGTVEQRTFLLTLDKPVEGAVAGEDHRAADTLYNLDACGAGFRIRRNHMRGNRRYGCLLRAGGGLVEDNIFEDTTGAGVVLTNEPDWPEGPMPWGITIRGNRFLRGGTCLGYADSPQGAALSVRATRLGHRLAEVEAIHDVIIENNEFQDRAGTVLFLGGASKVVVNNNRMIAAAGAELRRNGPAIRIECSSRVSLSDNVVSDPRAGTTAAVEIAPNVAQGERGIRISGLDTTLGAQTHAIDDRRAAP